MKKGRNCAVTEYSYKHRTWAEVDLGALKYNYERICESISGASVIAVVKADAYGHGAEACATALSEVGCKCFAVSCTMEALQIRRVLKNEDIIILGYTPPEDARILWENNITQTVFSPEYAVALDGAAAEYVADGVLPEDAVIRTHIKIDTGMNRLGFDTSDTDALVREVSAAVGLAHLKAEGLFTHFACADVNEGENEMTRRQLEEYTAAKDALAEAGITFATYHICNSAGTLWLPDADMSAVRAGIILYGLSPAGGGVKGLHDVMTLKTTVAHVHTVKAGETVSYGADFTAPSDMQVATLSIGYADGFLRSFARGGTVRLPDGTCAPVVGRVCMDQCMIDVTGKDTKPGDAVTVFGGDGGESLARLADVAETINYELICLIGKRTPRVYK